MKLTQTEISLIKQFRSLVKQFAANDVSLMPDEIGEMVMEAAHGEANGCPICSAPQSGIAKCDLHPES